MVDTTMMVGQGEEEEKKRKYVIFLS